MSRLDIAIFDSIISNQPQSSLEETLCSEDTLLFKAYRTTALQSPLAAKNLNTARKIANYILAENGEIDTVKLVEAIHHLSKCTYPLGPHRHNETKSREHILKMLKLLKEDPQLKDSIKTLFIPSYTTIQSLIRHTLALEPKTVLSTIHVRQAALTALFTYLRQDVGSCFATAPAILIHQEYPERFLKDINDLLTSGKLSRIVGTREITVPINLSGCIGELFKPLRILDLYPDPLAKLSGSPGLQKAFTAANLINTLSDPQIQIQQLLSHEYLMQKLQNIHEILTAHDIIKSTLLHYYHLDESTVRVTFFKEGLYSKEQILFSTQHPRELSEMQRVYHYLNAYEEAKSAFIHDTQNPLLKAWEYTLATLADASKSTTSDHIRIALGWQNTDPHSLLALIQNFVEEEIKHIQLLVQQSEQTYHEARAQLDYIESRMRNPLNNQDSQILSMDHMRFRQELNKALYEWDSAQEKVKKFLHLPDFLLSFYTKQIPLYFRSSYDAFIQEFAHLYADTPAGFRILFTHGRTHPHTWSPIYSINEFISFLSEFFTSTESDLLGKHAVVSLEKETSRLVHNITAMLHTDAFQAAVLTRILEAYKLPVPPSILHNLDQLSQTPWVYVSGGTVDTLLADYFETAEPLTIIEKHPENPHELAAFFADALKDLPTGIKNYLEESSHSLLASSPTHVFSIIAGSPLFREAWDNDWYSYTWLRDVWVKQHQDFLLKTILSQQSIYAFIENFCKKCALENVVHDFHDFCSDYTLTLPELYDKGTRFLTSLFSKYKNAAPIYIRRFLHHMVNEVPYISEQQLPEVLENISSYLGISSRITYDKFRSLIEKSVPKMTLLSSAKLRHLYKGLLMESYQKIYTEEDMYLRLASAMRHHNLAYPAPLLFGDSNWPYIYFGFILNPGTEEIDLWKFNYAGLQGQPLDDIEELFLISKSWTLYANPIDYGMPPPPGYRSRLPKEFF
ncbi:hypothetical protein C10C_0762 [Chlamydia serpentis]|uniref:Uncharacterized protein n=1 Tax=Chlamydia serpentis TaxID=1967782 RepID=A0A2R8FBU5_9CHLA|nr:hypothetical protein [Chlamydia serpentis]SPN73905.1 hypothetical protein C10C_0762 [Chlamydia serpentis]